jgi:hypothetical protein
MLLVNATLGLPGSILYDDHDPTHPSPGNIEDHFGLLASPLSMHWPRCWRSPAPPGRSACSCQGAGGDCLVLRQQTRGKVIALWSETDVAWAVRTRGREVRVLAADGPDLTPSTLAQGAFVPGVADGGRSTS